MISGGIVSAEGEALTTFPAIVAVFLICLLPKVKAAF